MSRSLYDIPINRLLHRLLNRRLLIFKTKTYGNFFFFLGGGLANSEQLDKIINYYFLFFFHCEYCFGKSYEKHVSRGWSEQKVTYELRLKLFYTGGITRNLIWRGGGRKLKKNLSTKEFFYNAFVLIGRKDENWGLGVSFLLTLNNFYGQKYHSMVVFR